MNNRIWKYVLDPMDEQDVDMPSGANVLYAAEQSGEIVVYAHVEPGQPLVQRHVYVHGTGHPTLFSGFAKPLGVVSMAGGALMFHVFVEPEGWRS